MKNDNASAMRRQKKRNEELTELLAVKEQALVLAQSALLSREEAAASAQLDARTQKAKVILAMNNRLEQEVKG